MPLKAKNTLVAVAHESTSGTAETLADADAAFSSKNASWTPTFETQENDSSYAALGGGKDDVSVTAGQITVETDLIGDDTTAPFWMSRLLPTCGMSVDGLVASVDSAVTTTATVGLYQDGVRKQIKGARSRLVIPWQVNQNLIGRFEFQGSYDAVSDQTLLTPTIPALTGPKVQGATFTIGGVSYCATAGEIVVENELQDIECITAANGIRQTDIISRRVTLTCDLEALTVAQRDDYGLAIAGTTQAIVLTVGTATNQVSFAMPAAQRIDIADSERTGLVIHDHTFLATNAAEADDEFAITVA